MSWADTAWGARCRELFEFFAPRFPGLQFFCGRDDEALHKGPNSILFVHVQETDVADIYGAPLDQQHTGDTTAQIRVEMWAPFTGTEENPASDTSPNVAESMVAALREALHNKDHRRRVGVIRQIRYAGGSAGHAGTKAVATMTLRLGWYSAKPATAAAEKVAISAATQNPNGSLNPKVVLGG